MLCPRTFRIVPAVFVAWLSVTNADATGIRTTALTGAPVLVVIENENPRSLKRSDPLARLILAELENTWQRYGIRMVNGESVAADIGLSFPDRPSRSDLLYALRRMAESRKVEHRHYGWVLLKVLVSARQLAQETIVTILLAGEIRDPRFPREFYGSLEMPRERIPVPHGCLASAACITEAVSDSTRKVTSRLGGDLAYKLAPLLPLPQEGTRGPNSRSGAVPTLYSLNLTGFDDIEALTLAGVIREELPGAMYMDLVEKTPELRRYDVFSTARAIKLEEWLVKQLRDHMGFDVRSEVLVQLQGNSIIVDKLVPTPDRPVSADERKRFN